MTPTWACLKEAMAWGFACGGGFGREEDMSLVRVPIRAPIAAPWAELVTVTKATSTGRDCFANHALNPVSNSLKRACICCNGFFSGISFATTIPCFPCSIQILRLRFASLLFSRRVLWITGNSRALSRYSLSSLLFGNPLTPNQLGEKG